MLAVSLALTVLCPLMLVGSRLATSGPIRHPEVIREEGIKVMGPFSTFGLEYQLAIIIGAHMPCK